MLISIIIFLVVCFFAWKQTMTALAITLQTNVVRSIVSMDFVSPCYYCPMDDNILVGAVAPIFVFVIIILKLKLSGKVVKYRVDYFDLLLVIYFFAFCFGTMFSIAFLDSFVYTSKFILLGVPYYFITKTYLSNSKHSLEKEFLQFTTVSIIISFIYSLLAISVLFINQDLIWRLTLPGVHPIPFSQMGGLSLLLCIILLFFYRKWTELKIKKTTLFILLVYFVLVVFATNTRGILVALVVSIIYLINLVKQDIFRKQIAQISIGIVIGTVVIVSQIDISFFFKRIANFTIDKSITERVAVYLESFSIFIETKGVGTGPGAFEYYSFLGYPHNLLLENLAVFGFIGVILNLLIISIIIWVLINSKRWKKYILLVSSICLFLFFFTEAMFSFTLWMQKGLFFTMALVSVSHGFFKTGRI